MTSRPVGDMGVGKLVSWYIGQLVDWSLVNWHDRLTDYRSNRIDRLRAIASMRQYAPMLRIGQGSVDRSRRPGQGMPATTQHGGRSGYIEARFSAQADLHLAVVFLDEHGGSISFVGADQKLARLMSPVPDMPHASRMALLIAV